MDRRHCAGGPRRSARPRPRRVRTVASADSVPLSCAVTSLIRPLARTLVSVRGRPVTRARTSTLRRSGPRPKEGSSKQQTNGEAESRREGDGRNCGLDRSAGHGRPTGAIGETLKVHSQPGKGCAGHRAIPSSRSSQPCRSAQGTGLTCSRVEWQAGSRSRMQSGKWTTPSCRQRSSSRSSRT